MTLTVANATKRFLERSRDKLSLKVDDVICARALFSDIVFLVALLFWKMQPVIRLTTVDDAPKTSIVDDSLP